MPFIHKYRFLLILDISHSCRSLILLVWLDSNIPRTTSFRSGLQPNCLSITSFSYNSAGSNSARVRVIASSRTAPMLQTMEASTARGSLQGFRAFLITELVLLSGGVQQACEEANVVSKKDNLVTTFTCPWELIKILLGQITPSFSQGQQCCHSKAALARQPISFHSSCSRKKAFFCLRVMISFSKVQQKGRQQIWQITGLLIQTSTVGHSPQPRNTQTLTSFTHIAAWREGKDNDCPTVDRYPSPKGPCLIQPLLPGEVCFESGRNGWPPAQSGRCSDMSREACLGRCYSPCQIVIHRQRALAYKIVHSCNLTTRIALLIIQMRAYSIDSSSSSSSESLQPTAYLMKKVENKLKKQALQQKKRQKEKEGMAAILKNAQIPKEEQEGPYPCKSSQWANLPLHEANKDPQVFSYPVELRWFIYPKAPQINIREKVPHNIRELPIFKKKEAILDSIIKNQFVLVTGETGCGKSTQVPRLIYQYLKATGQKAKIMCVQPRRLAVINLQAILEKQMQDRNKIGYQIGMKSMIYSQNQIVFVTNGIFLQRMVHSTDFFNEYPFIILDQVHERDIDTDFILLTIKRVIRQFPRVRIVLMSATIDNRLFKYYFASDHIDNILYEENFYKKVMRAKQQIKRERMEKMQEDEEEPDSDSREDQELIQELSLSFLKSKYPCPTINVTEPGKFSRRYFYLDTLQDFLPKGMANNRWGSVIFSDKYPNTNKELFESVCLIIDQISNRSKARVQKSSILIFMPGLAQIQNLSDFIVQFFNRERLDKQFQIINVHSTILNDDITRKLLEKTGRRHKIIISTNIAESSITVLGVEYVIDFCLTKEVRFDLKSKMENLQLVWTSKASCEQRAGRTGRVCDGTIIRLLEKAFYDKLQSYSTPQIQRSSLDKLILRIKLLHEGENNEIFAEPGEVLGSAIQPPNLKNIDTAINSLKFCGGLEWKDNQFFLTNLGRLYIDIPIDITYCKLLVISQLFGTFQDMLTLVSILSQSKNAIRRNNIEKSYMSFYELMENSHNCDFYSLISLYEKTEGSRDNRGDPIKLQIFSEVKDLKNDIRKRIEKKKDLFPTLSKQYKRNWKLKSKNSKDSNGPQTVSDQEKEEYLFKFKLTLVCGFIEHTLKVREPTLDDKQEKRLRLMKKMGIRHSSTVCLLGSNVLRKPESQQAEKRLINSWKEHLYRTAKIASSDFTVTYGLSYLHFNNEAELHKFLFYQYIQNNKKTLFDDRGKDTGSKNFLTMNSLLKSFGETDHMHGGRPVTFCKEQTVVIDNYSLNRVVNLNEGDAAKFMVTNNIAKQSSRMVARYTTLLPVKINYIQTIVHLMFYPFVSVSANRKKTRYESVQLSKKRHKIPIRHNINNEQIEKANEIRRIINDYLYLDSENSKKIDIQYFWEKVTDFIYLERPEVVEEERWQDIYMKELFERKPELREAYEEVIAHNLIDQPEPMDIEENQTERPFMNQIKLAKLSSYFFSNINFGDTTLEERAKEYNVWKQRKLRQVRAIERKAEDRDSYLACGEDSCGLRIAKMINVGPINNQIFRELFSYETENVEQLQFNDLDNHFCTLLMSNYINSEYKTFGCTNGHYFAIRLEGEKRVKILPFSQLMIIYPDGSAEKADFQRLEVKDWKRKHDEKSQGKYKLKLSTYCFVCDEMLDSFKNLQIHIKDFKHSSSVKEFIKTIPEEMREKKQAGEKVEESMY